MGGFEKVDFDEIRKMTHININAIGDRVIPLIPCLNDKKEWELWVRGSAGLVKIKAIPVQSDYFAREREKESDVYIEFINILAKHAYWPEIVVYIDGIRHDLHNLSASLSKIDLFFELYKEKKPVALYVTTETEYIFTVCKSIFDLLQEVIAGFWEKVQLIDTSIQKHSLPKTFRKMVMEDNKLMTIEQIQTKHQLPYALSEYYFQSGPIFEKIRGYRDAIIHSGNSIDLIFETERGFAIQRNMPPFSSFTIWNDKDVLKNNLASLRTLIAFVILETIGSCERFTEVIKRTIQLPPDIAPGYKIFIRGYHTEQLLRLIKIINEEPWWK